MRVGEDVQAVCGKCGPTWHVVLALVEGRAAKVECGDCHAQHRYRVPGGSAAARRKTGTRRSPGTRAARSVRPVVEADPSRPPRAFRTTETFDVGDRVEHPTLGAGVVQAVTGPSKIEVLFGGDRKILVHARK